MDELAEQLIEVEVTEKNSATTTRKNSKVNKLTKEEDSGQICTFLSSDDNRNFL